MFLQLEDAKYLDLKLLNSLDLSELNSCKATPQYFFNLDGYPLEAPIQLKIVSLQGFKT
jgi:hypothetical protein